MEERKLDEEIVAESEEGGSELTKTQERKLDEEMVAESEEGGSELTKTQERKLDEEMVAESEEGGSELTKTQERKLDEEMVAESEEGGSKLTKTQERKLRRLQRREDRHLMFKQKQKDKKLEKKQKRIEAKQNGQTFETRKRRPPTSSMADSDCKYRIAIDMRYDNLMEQNKDIISNVGQLSQAYGVNRRLANPLQLYLINFEGKSRERWNELHGGGGAWDVHMHEQSLETVFHKDAIVYLTSESENELDDVEESKVYVIGGLVDHNKHKGVCHNLAIEKGWHHARLPIDKYLPKLKTRKVLAVNHVFEILAKYAETKNWNDALQIAIPQRKFEAKSKKFRREENYEKTLNQDN